MAIYNLLEYCQNYPMTAEMVWNYYVDEIDDVNDNASDRKSFEYKTQILWKTPQRPPQTPPNLGGSQPPISPWPPESPQLPVPVLNVEVTIPLKYRSNVWRSLDLSLIDCEIELDLSWTEDCVLSEHYNIITGAIFLMNGAKLYVPVVTLSIAGNIKFLENIKQGFRRTTSWNKHRFEITT